MQLTFDDVVIVDKPIIEQPRVFHLEENGNKHTFLSVGARLVYEAEHKIMKGHCWHGPQDSTEDTEDNGYYFDFSFDPKYYENIKY